jgi:hypothetical protein
MHVGRQVYGQRGDELAEEVRDVGETRCQTGLEAVEERGDTSPNSLLKYGANDPSLRLV